MSPSATNQPLRIAMIGTPFYEMPPTGYGGIELICAVLVDGLVARGHQVTLFGGGTRTGTAATFVSTTEELQYHRLGQAMPEMLHAARVNRLLNDGAFDIVHDHSAVGPLAAGHRAAPTVVTVHGGIDGEFGDFYADLGDTVGLVAISEFQRRQRPTLNWMGTVHNAVDPAGFTANHRPDGPVLWLARFCPDKGPDLAIEACRAAGVPLVLAGKCNEPEERRYLDEKIRPMLGDDVRLVLNADRSTVHDLLDEASCLLLPIRWHEPFGMVMIEAMASGKPVVALRRGAVPEVVAHGVTGFVCDEPADLPAALLQVGELDPAACVAHVQARFSAEVMTRRYELMYHRTIQQQRARLDLGGVVAPDRIPVGAGPATDNLVTA